MKRTGLNIYHRKDGRWEGRYKCGYNEKGKAVYRSVYGKSYCAVKKILLEKLSEKEQASASCKMTVSEIAKIWLFAVSSRVKESTAANYAMKLEKHILPYFGGLKYELLTTEKLFEFVRVKTEGGLSEKYVADIVIILKSIARFCTKNYNYANRIEYASLSKPRRINDKQMLSDLEQKKLHAALIADNTVSSAGILLASVTGIRIGELCGLKWEDIDFENNTLTVKATVQRIKNSYSEKATKVICTSPKSTTSARVIPIPDFMMPILNNFRACDKNYILSGKEKPTEPRTMQYRFKKTLSKLSLTNVSFHSLRHMFATNCIALGLDVKTLSEIMGHSSVEITLNLYVHSSIDRKKAFMNSFSNKFFAA